MSFNKSSIGDQGENVARVQRYLQFYGYHMQKSEAKEGLFDESMTEAIIAFQTKQGLAPTGELDEATLRLMNSPRCGFTDIGEYAVDGRKWNKTDLTYGFQHFTNDLPSADVRWAIQQALGLWSAVSPLRFTEIPITNNPDIQILFATGDHGDGSAFDGANGVLAHAYYPPPNGGPLAGDAHFDDSETWSISIPPGINKYDLVTVAAHEFGHSLGLAHSSVSNALMYAYYGGPHRYLHADDIAGIQSIYPKHRQASKSSPSITSFGNQFRVGFIANNNSNDLLICSSTNGSDWTDNIRLNQAAQGGTAPSLTAFNEQLWCAFIANNSTNNVLVCSSADGSNWTNNVPIGQTARVGSSPSLTVFNNQLWCAFIANNSTNNVLVCASGNGSGWSNNTPIGQSAKGASSPALAVFNNQLWCAFIANNSTNNILVCSSNNGSNWSNNTPIGQTAKDGSSPSLCTFGGKLWVAFVANNHTNNVLVCSSANGVNWTNNTPINQTALSGTAPSLMVMNGRIWLSFIANNHTRNILICTSADGQNWSNNVPI